MFLREHVDIFNDTLIGCFAYFQNVIGWKFFKVGLSWLWRKYENVWGKRKFSDQMFLQFVSNERE